MECCLQLKAKASVLFADWVQIYTGDVTDNNRAANETQRDERNTAALLELRVLIV